MKGLRFVCSDVWQPYLIVMAAEASQALHVLESLPYHDAPKPSGGSSAAGGRQLLAGPERNENGTQLP